MSEELCRRLRQDARSSHHGRSAHEAATLIEQQAARIAVLEQQAWCGGTEAKTVRATRDEPSSPACAPCKAPGGTCFPEPCGRYQQRRAEAAEAEVKRRGIALELIAQHHGQCITEPPRLACDDPRAAYQEGSNQAFNKLAKIALDALAPPGAAP